MDKVIIDSSAWIESFKPEGDKALGSVVRELILGGQVLLPGIIRVELLRGAKNIKEYKYLSDILKGVKKLPVPEDFWERLGEFSFSLFRKGLAVPLVDTYIGLLCIEHKALILHRDRHFDMIAGKFPLRIFPVEKGGS